MKIAVLSGKGGTGKTTVSTSLFKVLDNAQYVDCDVEEPNGYIFLKPDITKSIPVKVEVPDFDRELCDGCGDCARACRFHALALIRKKVLTFSEICHHCGVCKLVCPQGAIIYTKRAVGVIETDVDGRFAQGRLNIGEPIAVPVIRELKKHLRVDRDVILDCSPGASCMVVATIEGCDYCILVTEPTPFGLHRP